jgi:hypothetical protein
MPPPRQQIIATCRDDLTNQIKIKIKSLGREQVGPCSRGSSPRPQRAWLRSWAAEARPASPLSAFSSLPWVASLVLPPVLFLFFRCALPY